MPGIYKIAALSLSLLFFFSCSKKEETLISNNTVVQQDTTVTIKPGVDPAVATTVGFFLEKWQSKTFVAPNYTDETVIATADNTVTIDAADVIAKIPVQIFGHNSNTWMGTFVDQPSFMTDITNLKPNVIRWPAGSGSDGYFWNLKPGDVPDGAPTQYMDNTGKLYPAWYGYGQSTDNWRASLSNYYSMLQQSNTKGIITANYGFARYGTSANPVATAAHLAADWVRFDNGRTEYWEIGNENYGDWEVGYRIDTTKNRDRQPEFLTGKLYAQHFKIFADSMRKAAAEVGTKIKIGAVMQESQTQSWQTVTTRTWNSTLIPELQNKADFYIVHNYITPFGENSTASTILNSALAVPSQMMNFCTSELISFGGEIKPFAFTEWNMWAQNSKQQVSNVSGLFAMIVQAEAIKNHYGLAARWDLLNGYNNGDDHGLFSDGGSTDDPRWNPRPSFYYMYYFQKFIGDRLVSTNVQGTTNVKAYASTYSSGQANVTLINTANTPQTFEIKTKNFLYGNRFYWYNLEGSTDNGEFSRKVIVNGSYPNGVAGGPANYASLKARSASTSYGMKITVPALGSVCVLIEKK